MINAILIIVGIMVYMFIGSLIGMFVDYHDTGFIVMLAGFWPAAILLYIPFKLADIAYTNFNRWRLSRK